MKTAWRCSLLISVALVLLTGPVHAQESTFPSWSSQHYRVLSATGEAEARQVAERLEAALVLFNGYFHYDLGRLPAPLRVRIFKDRAAYDHHLQALISETRSDFVFISYSDPSRNELVGFHREQQKEFDASLLHYGFIQFLTSFVPAPPLWLAEGMATCLEQAAYDSTSQSFAWRPNLLWLDVLKGILKGGEEAGAIPLADLILLDKPQAQAAIEVFYPTSWGLVHFLLNSPDKRYNRLLWDSVSALDPSLDLEQNSRRVMERAFSWVPMEELQSAFQSYILSLMTFSDLVNQGVRQYNENNLEGSMNSFKDALAMRADSYIPYYYLGLILYQRKAYDEAEAMYLRAQQRGLEAGLVQYALGVNAFAAQKYDLAARYLAEARKLDPAAYAEKVDSLLKRIEALR
jgi:tetratricopeptide (TPR) repeat protein